MKRFTLILFTTILTVTCFGQSLFFDNLNNSKWKSEAFFNPLTIKQSKDIYLAKMNHAKDSLKVDITIWTFRENELEISFYDCKNKTDSVLISCKYEIDSSSIKPFLILYFDNEQLKYKVGINSSGNFALLTRKKK